MLIKIKKRKTLIVVIPGGPGISNEYLKKWCGELQAKCKMKVILLDLPDNASVQSKKNYKKYNYPRLLKFIKAEIRSAVKVNQYVLIGHSFGAKITLDILSDNFMNKPVFAGFISYPVSYEATNQFNSRIKRIFPAVFKIKTEADFQAYFKKTLFLYFAASPRNDIVKLLTKKTSWVKNCSQTSLSTSFDKRIKAYRTALKHTPSIFIEGARDLRSPDNNFSVLKKYLMDTAKFIKIKNCGHFPMLEQPRLLTEIINKEVLTRYVK